MDYYGGHDSASHMLHNDHSVLPIYLLELGVPKADVALWSGLVFGITFLIAGIMAPIWGKIADNKGKNGWPCVLALPSPSVMY